MKLQFPWVSRERLAEAQKRLEAADAERARLLDLLLGGADPKRLHEIAAANEAANGLYDPPRKAEGWIHPVPVEGEKQAPARPVEAFSTPFDRMERRFAQTFPQGAKIPAKFMARVN